MYDMFFLWHVPQEIEALKNEVRVVKGAFWDYQMQVQKERMIKESGTYRY